ncbi:MAG: type II toxin-antitoxin system HicB family antitoxin [Candidatus Scalindua sp.]
MESLKYVHWQDDEFFIGHFVDYPDYLTQGKSLEELKENFESLYNDLISEKIPYIKKVDELKIA